MSSPHSEVPGVSARVRSWGVVIPAKRIPAAKSRLAPLGDEVRRELVVAFLHDTDTAVLDARGVQLVVVVTDDVALAATATGLGAWAIPDGHGSDLNASLVEGAADVVRRARGVGVLTTFADLPALTGADLDAWLGVEPATPVALVADIQGHGTTLLRAATPEVFAPAFGPGSRAAHLARGAHDLTAPAAPGLRRDVDTPDDLTEARRLGIGERTRWVLTRHQL